MTRRLLACVALLALCGAAGAVDAAPPKEGRVASTATQNGAPMTSPTDLALGAWQLYRSIFMVDGGRIIDRENEGVSHSEGQGYGMLIAATLGDRDGFERIWDWTERELFVREDNLAAWKWSPAADPHITDMNNATDGDILIAWALLRAHQRWGVRDHLREAEAIMHDVVDKTLAETRYGTVMLPGAEGFSAQDRPDGPVANLSYWVFPAIDELSRAMPFVARADLNASGRTLLGDIALGEDALPSEWTALGGEAPVPAEGFEPVFGYNALRIPLYYAWGGSADPAILDVLMRAWGRNGDAGLSMIDVGTGTAVGSITGRGYEAIAELAACSTGGHSDLAATRAFEPSTYYSSTLQLLTLIALSERYPQCF